MKESVYTTYDELPLFLNAEMVAKLLGISISSSYELMHEKGFPSLFVSARGSSYRKKSSDNGSKKRQEAAFEVQPLPKARRKQRLFSSAE